MVDVSSLPMGTRLRVAGDIVAEVVGAVDGEWVRVRIVEVPPGKSGMGEEELCHATDVVEVL